MRLLRSGIALAVLLAGCATPSSIPRCGRTTHFEGLRPLEEYRVALRITFPEVDANRGICVAGVDNRDGLRRCSVFSRLNDLEKYCYAVEEAYR